MTDTEHEDDVVDTAADTPRPLGVIEVRSAQLVEVRYPERLIDVIAMPYEEVAVVEFQGRMIREVCSRGAYDGVERRANRVKVNRDHDITRLVGRCRALFPSRTEGLVAEMKIAATPLGDETLALAEDGILDASAGFLPFPGGEQWLENRSLRRLVKCWLGHIALVPDPAYEGANLLALRAASTERHPSNGPPVATPNLDSLRLWELEHRFESYHPTS